MGNKCDNNRPHLDKKSPPSSISTMSGPSSPTPSISCETCTQLSQLEVEAFAAVGEVATFVKSISVSEILTRTPELLFLNLVTLERWRICSDRLDCMYGDFRKLGGILAWLEMHINYYETIYSLLDSLSKLYRDQFSSSLATKLGKLQEERTSKMTERTTLTSERASKMTEREEEEKTEMTEKSEDYDEDEVYLAHVRGGSNLNGEKPNIEE
uniref:GSKIP domain-containing protein n=1 Tax=Meloidogyne floridensis TaxID=298350 RepID=A0A915P1Q2_9BILA